MREAVILSAVRLPTGKFMGTLKPFRAPELGALVVREAVREYEARSTRLSDEERARMLAIVDRMVERRPTRSASEVDGELSRIRAARRRWSRGGPRQQRS